MTTRDTHSIKNYNSYQYHQGQGIATKVRDRSPTRTTPNGNNSKPALSREQLLDQQEILYNSHSHGSPLTNTGHDMRHATGIRTHLHNQVPSAQIVGKDTRSVLKDALANAHGVSRPQDFPAYQPTPSSGVARVGSKPVDTPLFVPKLDASPKRRLHQLSEDYLQKIWKEDQRKDDCAELMEHNVTGSPIEQLRRGDAGHDVLNSSTRRHLKNITDLQTAPDAVHGRAHNPNHLKSNIQLSSEAVAPVLSGRRRAEPGKTHASLF